MTIKSFTSILIVIALSFSFLLAQAGAYQTYIIHTYGGNALLPAVRQQLNTSRDGSAVITYEDKLVNKKIAILLCTVSRFFY